MNNILSLQHKTIAKIKRLVIQHPQFEHAYHLMVDAYEMNRDMNIPQHLICVGESGTGKSTLKQEIAKSYPPLIHTNKTIIPVLVIDTPALPTVKNLAEAVLVKLGDPIFFRGSSIDKTNRIFILCKQCEVKLIIFDELQHFIDRGKTHNALQVSDWLKSIIDGTQISTVLMGLERSEQLLNINEQLRRRFSRRITLSPFTLHKQQDIQSFAGVLTILDNSLALPLPMDLKNSDLLKRLHFATNGIISYMVNLMLGAYEIAFENDKQGIDLFCLEHAFIRNIWVQGIEHLNPFNPQFKWQRLNKRGMPFHKQQAHYIKDIL